MGKETQGDWYCKNCGYIVPERVTFAETCDTCHQPAQWHSAEEQSRITELEADLKAAHKQLKHAQESHAFEYNRNAELEAALKRIVEAKTQIDACGGYLRKRAVAACELNHAINAAAPLIEKVKS